ncbi:AAA family ATPase [Dehalococcoidia bacterium]|nr:AAA family ATPase [Dehalococcoidia bacterium]
MINLTENDKEGLQRILEYENTTDRDPEHFSQFGWSWDTVRVWPATLNRLIQMGLLEVVSHSNSYRGMKLTPEGYAIAQSLGNPQAAEDEVPVIPDSLPEDIFQDIVGHEKIKKLLRAVVLAAKPVHVLLSGPPALAKSLFLLELERVLGSRAHWALGSAVSKAGLQEMLLEFRPYVLLIDELDKMDGRDQAALLSVMEGGRVSRTKVGRMADEKIECRVVATVNVLGKLPPELTSRFAVKQVRSYTSEEFKKVVEGVLQRREGMEESVALSIAQKLDGRIQDVRDAIRVARLVPQVGLEEAIMLLLG